MGRDTKNGGFDPANGKVALSVSGGAGASSQKDIATVCTKNGMHGSDQAQYSIVTWQTQNKHDPLEEALQRLDDAYTDAVNMAIASYVDSGLITEDEARRIHEQRQVWQEVRV